MSPSFLSPAPALRAQALQAQFSSTFIQTRLFRTLSTATASRSSPFVPPTTPAATALCSQSRPCPSYHSPRPGQQWPAPAACSSSSTRRPHCATSAGAGSRTRPSSTSSSRASCWASCPPLPSSSATLTGPRTALRTSPCLPPPRRSSRPHQRRHRQEDLREAVRGYHGETISRLARLSLIVIQITGILGIKAYRCLGNARVVPAALIFISVVMYTLLVMEVLGYSGYRGAFGELIPVLLPLHHRSSLVVF